MSDAAVHATVADAQKEFFHLQVAASFHVADVPSGGSGGAVGEVNRAISNAAHACINQLPSDRYSLNSNQAMLLAMRRLMQARDAVIESVAMANATPVPVTAGRFGAGKAL